ncbi:MAG: hypothetical protein ACRCYC_12260 [Paraclostridium sp.]|uniref:hypothetical protein n=1 Tax=Paraclostridium sp. TaxID=2023273 RepID=UPI003F3C041D
MKKQCRELLKKNNKSEKEIHKNNDTIYTDMIVYLRGSDMTSYNQELVREDLIQMILDGQDRGENIEKVIGKNYKEICDEIIETMPKKTKLQKIVSSLELSLSIIWILGAISIAKTIIINFVSKNKNWDFVLSIGDIINMIIIIFIANLLVEYTCKTALNNTNKNKILSFLKTWLGCMAVLLTMIMSSYYLNTTIINLSLLLVSIIIGIVFILAKIISRYVA